MRFWYLARGGSKISGKGHGSYVEVLRVRLLILSYPMKRKMFGLTETKLK